VTSIRLLALDLDGTLVQGEDAIRPRTLEALLRAHEAGIALAIATGRRWRRTRPVVARLGLPVPAVCLGGALVKDAGGVTLRANAFDREGFALVAGLVAEHGHTAVAQRDGEDGAPDFLIDGSLPWNGWSRRYWERNRDHAAWASRLAGEVHDDVLVVGTFGPREALAGLAAEIEHRAPARFAPVVTPLPADPAGGHYLEVVPRHVSKWEGLRQLAEHAGVPPEAICAVGDERNDLSMLRAAGLGVAMGNAPPEVQAAAHWVTGRADEDGLVAVVERILVEEAGG
jgi:Cof subfamily protein (haloacid dehalogenase superfamily)